MFHPYMDNMPLTSDSQIVGCATYGQKGALLQGKCTEFSTWCTFSVLVDTKDHIAHRQEVMNTLVRNSSKHCQNLHLLLIGHQQEN